MSWFGSPAIGDPEDEEELRAVLAWYMENSSNVILEVDGVAVENIWDYRIITNEFFGFWVPEANVPNDDFGVELHEGFYSPAAGDGIFVMLAPLSAGDPESARWAGLPATSSEMLSAAKAPHRQS